MTEHEIEHKQASDTNTRDASGESAAEAGGGISRELHNQIDKFEAKKPGINSDLSQLINGLDNVSVGISEKDREKAVLELGKDLQGMLTGELSKLRDMMKANGIDTKEVDKKIEAAGKEADAAKPLHDALVKGDVKSLQKLLNDMKPEDVAKQVELLQRHFDRAGLGLQLDYAGGQLIVSQNHGDRAVAISKDKLDVIGINKDGSYDFSRQFRRENPANELSGMSNAALSNFLYPIKQDWRKHALPLDKFGFDRGYGGGGGISDSINSAVDKVRNWKK